MLEKKKKDESYGFMQLKGTDICMDLRCGECGTSSHLDGFFAYYVQCPSCEAIFEVGSKITLDKVDKADGPLIRGE